ncbi:hypothetical protein BHM03_00053990 [Ensete ventricosum]|nr:hypothetical protein BHM03_00053990 [Ensete ventricosum]
MVGALGSGSASRKLARREEIPQLGSAASSCKKVESGARAFIVRATGHSYLRSLLSKLFTMSLYFITPSVVLAVRRASCFLQLWRVDLAHLTRVRSTVRLLTPLYVRSTPLCRVGHADGLVVRGHEDVTVRSIFVISCPPPEKTFSRFPIRVLKMRSCAEPSVCGGQISPESRLIRPSRNDLAKRENSGTHPCDFAERANSGTNLGDLSDGANSGTNLGDLAERANSGTNRGDLAERANSGTHPCDFAERANSGTNLGDLSERTNPDTNLGDLAERELETFV